MVRSWLLWAGPGAVVTSWTALGLLGVIGTGPRMPILLEVPFSRDRAGQRKRARLRAELPTGRPSVSVDLCPMTASGELLMVQGMAVRPLTVALCAAVNGAPSSVALGLATRLLDVAALSEQALFRAAQDTRCTRLLDLLFDRWRS
jgi:hypothetical protein